MDNHNVKWLKIGELCTLTDISDDNPDLIWIKKNGRFIFTPIMRYRFISLKEFRKKKLEKIWQEKN